MTAPPWGHKPAPVSDRYAYWSDAPPEPSERAVYWIRRWREGSWRPNRWVWRDGYDSRASRLGIWIWESSFVLHPLDSAADRLLAEVAATVAEWSRDLPGPYWTLLEERSRPEGGAEDLVVVLAEAMRLAVQPTATARPALMGRQR